MTERLVVVGGDAAGMSAASAARRERGRHTSYSACGIPYFIDNHVPDVAALIARTPQQFARDYAIDARTGHEVVEIDLDRRAVRVRDGYKSHRVGRSASVAQSASTAGSGDGGRGRRRQPDTRET
jgi:NADPH-dependent 2,4-dienoyl-CoA reductase/sulfur reductase-like enzyme